MLIFAYGSLVAEAPDDPRAMTVDGMSRAWGVAMDNRVDVAGYKAYFDRVTGERHDGFVAFLDIQFMEGITVDGRLIDIAESDLPALNARERNYERVDISELVEESEPVFTYVGSLAGRRRLQDGRAGGNVVISAGYLSSVSGVMSEAELAALPFPVRNLQRVDL